MKAFVVSLNGRPLVTAGVGDSGVLNSHVVWTGGTRALPSGECLYLQVGGLDSGSGEHVVWSVPEIAVGDEIAIKAIETDQVTPEDERFRPDTDRKTAASAANSKSKRKRKG
jgi:hypothetical protein